MKPQSNSTFRSEAEHVVKPNIQNSYLYPMDHFQPNLPLLNEPEWAQLTYAQLHKDAQLSGLEWTEAPMPARWEDWLEWIYVRLLEMDKQSPELLSRFLYRVDLPEVHFRNNPFPSRELAEAILRREFMKVWLKAKYR